MKQIDYQKNILLELMNLEEFKQKDFVENKNEQITSSNITSPSKATSTVSSTHLTLPTILLV